MSDTALVSVNGQEKGMVIGGVRMTSLGLVVEDPTKIKAEDWERIILEAKAQRTKGAWALADAFLMVPQVMGEAGWQLVSDSDYDEGYINNLRSIASSFRLQNNDRVPGLSPDLHAAVAKLPREEGIDLLWQAKEQEHHRRDWLRAEVRARLGDVVQTRPKPTFISPGSVKRIIRPLLNWAEEHGAPAELIDPVYSIWED